MESRLNPFYSTPVAIILGAVIISGAILINGGYIKLGKLTGTPIDSSTPTPLKVDILVGHLPVQGEANAKVTVIEFADFQCPFCAAVSGLQPNSSLVQSLKQKDPSWAPFIPGIMDDYVKTGKAKFAYRHYAFLGQESIWAAQASECANEQDKFWEYHDYLFTHQGAENSGAFAKDKLVGFATSLGLNTDQFKKCLDSDKYLEKVKSDTEDGQKAGVDGTPATFVNGKLISGAQSYSAFKAAIDSQLK